MSDDDFLYDDLPEDPELAFLSLEAHFKRECEEKLAKAHQEERTDVYFVQYISRILAAINELGLEHQFSEKSVPSIGEVNYSTYLNFSKDVEHYRTKLQIRTVDKLDVSQSKKEALFAKIVALESEINRSRTRFDAVAALWVEVCEKVGEGVEKLEPLRKLIDSVGNLIGAAKKEEETQAHALPAPKTPKQIAPPKESDDDIPF